MVYFRTHNAVTRAVNEQHKWPKPSTERQSYHTVCKYCLKNSKLNRIEFFQIEKKAIFITLQCRIAKSGKARC